MRDAIIRFGISVLCLMHIFLSIFYSMRMSWHGDEWYTYLGETIMAFPNTLLVNLSKSVFGSVSIHNYLFYRQIGLFWVLISLLFVILQRRSSKSFTRRIALFHFCFIVFSSYVFFQEQYFRYYGFYLLCSIIVFYVMLLYNEDYPSRRKLFFVALLVSPFLHFFLTWQLLWYIILKEFYHASRKSRIVFLPFLVVGAILIVVLWKPLMALIMPLAFGGMHAHSMELRGMSLGLFAKPIYAVFQFVFGYDIEPTENVLIIGLFTMLGIGFLYRVYKLYSESRTFFHLIIFAGIVPLLTMHLILEPLTLPGATQFESKHALFFLPVYLAAFVPVYIAKKRILSFILPAVILISTCYGTTVSLSSPTEDWSQVVELASDVQGKGGIVVVDGRSRRSFLFYGEGQIDTNKVSDFQQVVNNQFLISNAPAVLLLVSDWKSYQILSLRQSWNMGGGTVDRFSTVSIVFELVRKSDKVCTGAYGKYPMFAFKYESGIKHGTIVQPKPCFFTIPYRDVELPIHKDGIIINGWQELVKGDTLELENSTTGELILYHFIESGQSIPEGTYVGSLQSNSGSVDLLLGSKGTDTYSSTYCRSLQGGVAWLNWRKRPVITQSLKYPGSYWPSTGHIYTSIFDIGANAYLTVSHSNVVLAVCGIDLIIETSSNK